MATKAKTKIKTPKWTTIKDNKVILCWKCPECGDTAEVDPTFFQDSGTPMCGECDTDMVYVKTQIQL